MMDVDSELLSDALGMIDVAFIFDATGSMASYIAIAREKAEEIATKIAAEGDLDIRWGVVFYRDHPPQDEIPARVIKDFDSKSTLTTALASIHAVGGGDTPESVWDGIAEAGNLQGGRVPIIEPS